VGHEVARVKAVVGMLLTARPARFIRHRWSPPKNSLPPLYLSGGDRGLYGRPRRRYPAERQAATAALGRDGEATPLIETTLEWQEGLRFRASTALATLDLGSVSDGRAGTFGPKELVAVGLGGCTGMDVASILEKMRAIPDHFRVEVSAETAPEHPKSMIRFTLRYRIDGKVTPEQARRAVELSLTRYCGVSATLAHGARIEPEIVLNGERLEVEALGSVPAL
jgi:putative redox protein